MENLAQFAERKRLRIKREDGEIIVPGKWGHLYAHDDELFGILVMPNGHRPRLWPGARRRLEAVGCTIWQDGGTEGTALFDPQDHTQASLAIRLAGIKRRRRAAGRPFTSSRAKEIGKATQFRPSRRLEGPERPQTRGIGPGVEEMAEPELIGSFRPAN